MRYDTPIFFIRDGTKTYDPATGNYAAGQPAEMEVYASVMDTRTETLNLVYGGIRQGSYTVQLQNHYSGTFDRIRIGAKYYRVDFRRSLRVKDVFIVSEVQ